MRTGRPQTLRSFPSRELFSSGPVSGFHKASEAGRYRSPLEDFILHVQLFCTKRSCFLSPFLFQFLNVSFQAKLPLPILPSSSLPSPSTPRRSQTRRRRRRSHHNSGRDLRCCESERQQQRHPSQAANAQLPLLSLSPFLSSSPLIRSLPPPALRKRWCAHARVGGHQPSHVGL